MGESSTLDSEYRPTEAQPESTGGDDLVGPQEIEPSGPSIIEEVPPIAEESGTPTWVVVGEDLLILIVIGTVIVLLFLGYVAYKNRYIGLVEERATNPEVQLEVQALDADEVSNLEAWKMNEGEKQIPDVTFEKHPTQGGTDFEIVFKQNPGVTKTIIANNPLKRTDTDNCYFELEIGNTNQDINVVLGMATKESYDSNTLPGSVGDSLGFHSKGGVLFIKGQEINRYDLDVAFGETMGIGYNYETNRIYLFCNGKYLNEPQKEFGSPNKKEKVPPRNPQKSPMKNSEKSSPEKSPEKKEEKPQKVDVEIEKKEYYVVVGVTGPCTVYLNIGGAPFTNHQKAIAKGIL